MFDTLADMMSDRDQANAMVGQVVTFNGLADYIEAHTSDEPGPELKGRVGFVCEYQERWYDDGDPENGPHLACDAWFDVYVPSLGRSIASDPNEWAGVVQIDWLQTA